jgi:hypothetical protein
MTSDEARAVIARWEFEPGTGGVPRVPEWVAPMFSAYREAVLSLGGEEAMLCYRLLMRLHETCDRIRRDGRERVLPELEQEEGIPGYLGRMWAPQVRERLDSGQLPFSNADVLPVRGGAMAPAFGLGPAMAAFADRNIAAYDELDRYGRIAHDWAQLLAESGA